MIELLETHYIAAIDQCTAIGNLLKSPILRIDSLVFYALNKNITKEAAAKNSQFIDMIKEVVKDKALYFSNQLNLTLSIQKTLSGISKNIIRLQFDMLNQNGDERFFFNHQHCQLFSRLNMKGIITPIINGFFSVLKNIIIRIDSSFLFKWCCI